MPRLMQQYIEMVEAALAASSQVQQGFFMPVDAGALDREAIPDTKIVYFTLPLSSGVEMQSRGGATEKDKSALIYFYGRNASNFKNAYTMVSIVIEDVVEYMAEQGVAVKAFLEADVEVYGFGDIVVTATISEV